MSIQPAKTYTVQFTADGVSSSVPIDCSLAPISENFKGNLPTGVIGPSATSTFTGPLAGVTAQLNGQVVTFTFSSPPPQLDGGGNTILYSATFTLQFAK